MKLRLNHSNSEKRADDGRKGRGADAFSPKQTDDWDEIMQRIKSIAERHTSLGEIPISSPIHAKHVWLKATKF